MVHQKPQGGRRDPLRFQPVQLSMFIDEVVDQQRYILSSLPQWRKHDRYDIKTVEEVVVTEILPVHFFLKILIGCNDDSNVDFDRLVAAPRVESRSPGELSTLWTERSCW